MKRRGIFRLLYLSIILFIIGAILTSPQIFPFCQPDYWYCFDPFDEWIGQPFVMFGIALFLISIIFLILPNGFRAWKRFSLFYLPIVAVLIIFSPAQGGGLYGFDKEIMTWVFSILFLFISIIIAIVKRKPHTVAPPPNNLPR